MIYLIGGPPRCGKTTVARALATHLRCPWVQGDYLGAMISRYVPEAAYGLLRPEIESMALDNDVRYATFTAMEVVDHYRGRAAVAWPGLRALIEYAAADGEDLIVEGYHVEPAMVAGLAAATSAVTRALFLYRTDLEETLAALQLGSHANDWVRQRTARQETYPRIARMIVRYGEAIRDSATREGRVSLAMDGPFPERVDQALRLLR